MTVADVQLTLTEDEVVAVAALEGRPWPTPFTLRRQVDANGAARSAERGALSLVVRRLAVAGDGGLALTPELRSVVDASSVDGYVALYRGSADDPGVPSVPVVYVHGTAGDQVLVEVESGIGARVLTSVNAADVLRHVVSASRATFEGSGGALHVARVRGHVAEVFTSSPGRLTEFVVDESGTRQVGRSLFWDDSRVATLFHLTAHDPDREETTS